MAAPDVSSLLALQRAFDDLKRAYREESELLERFHRAIKGIAAPQPEPDFEWFNHFYDVGPNVGAYR